MDVQPTPEARSIKQYLDQCGFPTTLVCRYGRTECLAEELVVGPCELFSGAKVKIELIGDQVNIHIQDRTVTFELHDPESLDQIVNYLKIQADVV